MNNKQASWQASTDPLSMAEARRLDAWVEQQRAKGDCALVRGWCLVHDEVDTMDHHFDVHPNDTKD